MTTLQPSTEQQTVIDTISGHNVVVNSAVGSGKTSTILFIAEKYKDENILLLTYNKRLKFETREKSASRKINNIEVHSFHSFCVQYYDNKCFTDYEIVKVLENKDKILGGSKKPFTTIIIDEAQDLTQLYYRLVMKIARDFTEKTQLKLCVIGDRYQSIYVYNNSDERYLVKADVLFKDISDRPWKHLALTETFRMTVPMVDFVNKCLVKPEENRLLRSNKKSPNKVKYIICNQFIVTTEVEYFLSKGYTNNDIFVLAPSVKNDTSPVKKLANRLSMKKIPIYCPMSDEEKLDSDIISNKVVFCTFHQAKGLERKVILVFGFDNSYFKYYKQQSDPTTIPNELYVAITRSLEHLVVFHHYANDFLPFVNSENIYKVCNVVNKVALKVKQTEKVVKQRKFTVTQLLKHLPIDVIEKALEFITIKEINKAESSVDIDSKVAQVYNNKVIYENVSDINGIAIPAYYENMTTGSMTIKELLNQKTQKTLKKIVNKNEEKQMMFRDTDDDNKTTTTTTTISEVLQLANKWNSISNGHIYKTNQITQYNWMTSEVLKICIDRLKKQISSKAMYEVAVSKIVLDCNVVGYVDCVDVNVTVDLNNSNLNLWEFKCTAALDKIHFIQTAIYLYLYSDSCNAFLFNIFTNNVFKISSKSEGLEELVKFLITYKLSTNDTISDEEFLKNNLDKNVC